MPESVPIDELPSIEQRLDNIAYAARALRSKFHLGRDELFAGQLPKIEAIHEELLTIMDEVSS